MIVQAMVIQKKEQINQKYFICRHAVNKQYVTFYYDIENLN